VDNDDHIVLRHLFGKPARPTADTDMQV